jgi:predicted AlkP superfamily phosphohydrolase/phosphomutase
MEAFGPNPHLSGICMFYLQEVAPNFRLYSTPINNDPSEPAITISEPPKFIEKISKKLGKFYTTGFQEDFKALDKGIFTDDEFETQATIVLKERLNLLNYALDNYDDGLLFFYFSSTDVQSHMFWWDSDEKHPIRSDSGAKKYFGHLKKLYTRMDSVMGDIIKRYGKEATILAMSDHGFANFKRQFNLNTWLQKEGYLGPEDAKSVLVDVDWSKTRAYGLGINGLYLNMIGRERDGIVAQGSEREELLDELVTKLQSIKDTNGQPVIRNAYRSDKVYKGDATRLAPDIIVGYHRGYRASWVTCLGNTTDEVLTDNESAWSADHCGDPLEVPGVLFSNKPITVDDPALIDVAPSILAEYGLEIPKTMQGKNIFS